MDSLDKAIADARDALESGYASLQVDGLRNLLAALDAARGEAVAWETADGGMFKSRLDALAACLDSEPTPLYAAPPAALAVPPRNPTEAMIEAGRRIITPERRRAEMYDAAMAEQAQQPAAAVPEGYVPLAAAEALALEAMRVGNLGGHERTVEGHWSAEVGDRFEEFMFEEGFDMLAAAERKGNDNG